MTTISSLVALHAQEHPDGSAFIEGSTGAQLTWREYDASATSIASALATRYARDERIALQIPSEIAMHIAMLACERAGIVAVGIGARAGNKERDYLRGKTGAQVVLTELPAGSDAPLDPQRALDATELSFLNSTSGTTGLPKCVMHNQRRWFAFHELAAPRAQLHHHDVFMSLLPAPFGFGLWTAHFTPTILGAPCVVFDRFDAAQAAAALAEYAVTVVAAVSTQFVMMLNADVFAQRRPERLRVLFTGGEMVPPDRAAQWELETGSRVLQFYGSNETGALSATALEDPDTVRLHTAGHIIAELSVRLYDPDTGADITATGGPGIAACKGEINCLGYLDDDHANQALYTPDGWMRTGDLCTIDSDGVLTVAGRASDFIIRGGKNISAAVVEQECATMPGVLLAAAVAKRDSVYGERVCVFLAVAPETPAINLETLRVHLSSRGVGKEYWPEYVRTAIGDLVRSSGGKVAKAELRALAEQLPQLETR